MQTLISYAELDQVAGEVLPERAVMSTVVTPIVGGGGGSDGGATMLSACQGQQSQHSAGSGLDMAGSGPKGGDGGLLGGLGGSLNSSNLTCVPAAVGH